MRYSILALAALAAVVASSALASTASAPVLVATVNQAIAHKPYPKAGAVITLVFTVHEPEQAAGTGVPTGSVFEVELVPKKGLPTHLVPATGQGGQYHATIRWPGGLIRKIRIGGFLNGVPSTAQGGFWLPVAVLKKNF